MTITRKPTRKTGVQTGTSPGADAEEFIKAAQHAPARPEPDSAPEPDLIEEEPPPVQGGEDEKPIKKDKKHKEKKKKNKKKEAVLIRFDNSQLASIDQVAEKLGLSRAAWVRMVVAKALPQD